MVGVQLRIARPIGECTADVVVAFTSVVDSVQSDGSNAQLDADVFGKLRHILFHVVLDYVSLCDRYRCSVQAVMFEGIVKQLS